MKHLKTYENTNIPRVLGLGTGSLYDIEATLDSAKQHNIKTNVYISKLNEINDSIVTFPEIYKDNTAKSAVKYTTFINNGYGYNFYNWYSIKYINNIFIFLGTNLEEVKLKLSANKYNL